MIRADDKEMIDEMTLATMNRVICTCSPFMWPFKDSDLGEYFWTRYEELGGNKGAHASYPD